ncbi:MAG: hypothetical protein ACLQPH_03195, partial [Acidimicrobiales bacterium]
MIRRVLLGTGALALVLGAAVGVGTEVASATPSPPVTLTGTVTCAVQGSIKFGVALTSRGTSHSTVTVKAKLSSCGGPGASQSGLTVKGGDLMGTSKGTFPSNCDVLTNGSELPSINGVIKWKTRGGTAVSSTVAITSESAYYDPNKKP